MSKLQEFVRRVEAWEATTGEVMPIPVDLAVEAKNYIKKKLAAVAKGGRKRWEKAELSDDPKKVSKRESQRKWREKDEKKE